MLMQQLIGYAAGGAVTYGLGSPISGGTGTNIGDMTSSGGLAAAFDGNTSQNYSSSATTASGGTAYIGKNYSSAPKRIFKAVITGSTDTGIDGGGGAGVSVTLTLRGKNGGAPSGRTDGTLLGQSTVTEGDGLSFTINNGGDLSQLWDYVWMDISHASFPSACAELVFHESVPV